MPEKHFEDSLSASLYIAFVCPITFISAHPFASRSYTGWLQFLVLPPAHCSEHIKLELSGFEMQALGLAAGSHRGASLKIYIPKMLQFRRGDGEGLTPGVKPR